MQTLLPQGLPVEMESVSNVTATNSVALGEVRFTNGEEYVYCYNAGTGTLAVGNFAVLSANSGYSICQSSITNLDYPIGFCKHVAIPAASYGWLLTRGFSKINLGANNSATTGDLLVPGANGFCVTFNSVSNITNGLYNVVGQVVSGAASGSSAQAFVRCFGT